MSEKILIIGPSWVGDMVMAQALFKFLKHQSPTARLEVLAPAWTFSLLDRMPEVDQAIEHPFKHGELKLYQRYQFAKKLRKKNYDQAIILANSFKSALIPWWARIPKRTGWLGEYRYFLLNDIRHLNKNRYPLMVEQYLALGMKAAESKWVAKDFYPSFQLSSSSEIKTEYERFLDGRPILAIAPGAAFGPSKCWPAEYYAEVANQKLKAGWDVWIFGSEKDLPIAKTIMEISPGCINFVGELKLAETIDLLALTDGLISNDSGLMHVAAGLKKPVIGIYGSTSPTFTPPLSESATILKLALSCQPCFKRTCPFGHYRCLRELLPAQVLDAISQWTI